MTGQVRLAALVVCLASGSCVGEDGEAIGGGGPADRFGEGPNGDVLCTTGTDLDAETSSAQPCSMAFSGVASNTPVNLVVRLVDFSRLSGDPDSQAFLTRLVNNLSVAYAGSRFNWVAGDVINLSGDANPRTAWQASRIARREHPFYSNSHLTVYRFETIGGLCGFAAPIGWDFVFREQGRAVPNPGVYISNVVDGCGDPTGTTSAHEIGHWFGLYHTFTDECDLTLGGDLVADTPRHAYSYYQGSCAAGGPVETTDTCPGDPGTDPQRNHMAYSDCSDHFTPGQFARASLYWSNVIEPVFGR